MIITLNDDPREVLKKISSKYQYEKDERFWNPTVKDGKGKAFIRFIPDKEGNCSISFYQHVFKVGGRTFFAICPTSFGKKCPLCEMNAKLWDSKLAADQDLARTRKRIKKFVSNIYVIKDDENPSTVGKVYLFKYGKKINKKIEAMFETLAEKSKNKDSELLEDAVHPWSVEDGAIFKLEITTEDGFYNYDTSTFIKLHSPLADSKEKIEEIINQTYILREYEEELKRDAEKIEEKMRLFGLLETEKPTIKQEVKDEIEAKKIDVSDLDLDEDFDDIDEILEEDDEL